MWKIIAKDNFDRDTISDRLVCDNIMSHWDGQTMVDALNGIGTPDRMWFYRLVEQSHELYQYNP